jgi:cytochrome c biogenesis protein CcmG, thiol:disulfide interchange protein DsbE
MGRRIIHGWRWALVPLLAVPLGWILFTSLGRDPRLIPSPLVGQPLPALTGTTLGGASFSSASLSGRPVLINIWAPWCSPCVIEHPLLLDAARQHADTLQIVGIIYHSSAEAATHYLAAQGDGGWPDLVDPNDRLALQLGVTGPPETFFVDAEGVVRYHHVGPLTADLLAEQLAALEVSP